MASTNDGDDGLGSTAAPHRRSGGVELDRVVAPGVVLDGEMNADDSGCAVALGFALHARHRQLARLVVALRPLRHLGVAAHLPQGLHKALRGNVKDAVAHDERHRRVTRSKQGRQVLSGQVAGEGLTVGAPKRPGFGGVADRGADRDELQVLCFGAVLTPFQANTDDTVGAQRVGFGLHAGHGVPARAIRRLGEHR